MKRESPWKSNWNSFDLSLTYKPIAVNCEFINFERGIGSKPIERPIHSAQCTLFSITFSGSVLSSLSIFAFKYFTFNPKKIRKTFLLKCYISWRCLSCQFLGCMVFLLELSLHSFSGQNFKLELVTYRFLYFMSKPRTASQLIFNIQALRYNINASYLFYCVKQN